jgi:hypothetical protein
MTRTPIRTASSVLRELFIYAEVEGVTQRTICEHVDSLPHELFRWRAGQRTPNIMKVEAIAEALGLRLVAVPKEDTPHASDVEERRATTLVRS